MFDPHKRFALRALPLLLGLGAAGLAFGAGPALSTDEPISCEIQADSANGMIVLQGIVHADTAINGLYRLKVQSAGGSGNSNISQGGAFAAGPGQPAVLGKVMLGSHGAIYDASLEISANGVTIACDERVGGAI